MGFADRRSKPPALCRYVDLVLGHFCSLVPGCVFQRIVSTDFRRS